MFRWADIQLHGLRSKPVDANPLKIDHKQEIINSTPIEFTSSRGERHFNRAAEAFFFPTIDGVFDTHLSCRDLVENSYRLVAKNPQPPTPLPFLENLRFFSFSVVFHLQGFGCRAAWSHLGYWVFMMTIQSAWTEHTYTISLIRQRVGKIQDSFS